MKKKDWQKQLLPSGTRVKVFDIHQKEIGGGKLVNPYHRKFGHKHNNVPVIKLDSGRTISGGDCWWITQEDADYIEAHAYSTMKHAYSMEIYNGRVKVKVDGYIFFCFNQLDFKGFYSYKDDTSLYGIDIYLMGQNGGITTMEIYFKTKEVWLAILKLLDERL